MKKLITSLLLITLLALSFKAQNVNASDNTSNKQVIIERLGNGDYYETIIEDAFESNSNKSLSAKATNISKVKTIYYKKSDGTKCWSVSINATFTYDGTTSKCTACSHYTNVYASRWSIDSSSSSKSGNSATAKATARYSPLIGFDSTYTKSVTIKCSATGVIS